MSIQMRLISPLALALLLAAGLAPSARADDPKAAAQKAAEGWLAVVDQGRYPESWEQAAAAFRAAITKDSWKAALDSARKPLGAIKSRKLKSAQYTTSLPGAPEGQYVVLQFDAIFENKTASIETVTPMLEKDGAWRVSGYYVR